MGNTSVIVLEESVVTRGVHAWGKLKATSAEQRELWRSVGAALLVGRRLHPSNQAFGKWCTEAGFDMRPQVRADAMWFAEQGASYSGCNTESHPTNIRQWHRENTPQVAPIVGLSDIEAPRPRITLSTASKVNKLAAMAERGEGGEQAIAKRHLKAASVTAGMTPEELTSLAAKTDPLYGKTPDVQNTLSAIMELVQGEAMSLVEVARASSLTRETVVALVDRAFDAYEKE